MYFEPGQKSDYEKAGVREYLVVALRQRRVYWFIRRRGKFRELRAGEDGVFRSEVFPGLWLDGAAFLASDRPGVLKSVRLGIASAEHTDFAKRLVKKHK